MEMEQSPSLVAKKLWSMVKTVFYMLGKGIAKSKLLFDLHMLLKRGKIAGKAMGNVMLQHDYAAAFSCRSNDIAKSFVSPHLREYEFSCSNSPVYPSYYSKQRKYNHNHRKNNHQSLSNDINVVQKVLLEMLNNQEAGTTVEASPLVTLPGFGRSPMVKQLRVTDSPFPLKDTEDTTEVNKAAEEFIKKFYKDLKQQKRIAALASTSPYHLWAR